MKNYQYKTRKNNLIEKIRNTIKRNPEKLIQIIAGVIVFVAIIAGIFMLIKENQKQKWVAYNGKNINEVRYPGYKELLDNLKEKHPNWTFTLFYTKLNWEEVIANEGHKDNVKYPSNLIPDSSEYPEDWKCEIMVHGYVPLIRL